MDRYRTLVEARLAQWTATLPDGGLYAPMAYLLGLPAKRVRPTLVLMACELFGGRAEDALDEALGIELFHNFTLMHDDIMDASPLRRGQPTVHVKWDVDTAILSGDALLVKAYQLMGRRARVLELFGHHALLVCEGQQLDMAFERRSDVSLVEYREMIRRKTAVLLSCALQVGACIAGAPEEECHRIGDLGEHLGLAFQLRDDLLDAFGEPEKVGKRPGGDLRAGKKTFLLIRGLERAAQERWSVLDEELKKPADQRDVQRMLDAIEALGVRREAEEEVALHEQGALRALDAVAAPEERKAPLRALHAQLMGRAY